MITFVVKLTVTGFLLYQYFPPTIGLRPTILNTAVTSPEISGTPTEFSPTDWLDYVNKLRSKSGLPGVAQNIIWNEACQLHSRYMVKNDTIEHNEDLENIWFTSDGAAAAVNSNVMVSSNARSNDQDAILLWMSEPFHGIGLIDPQLETVGFGSYREAIGTWKMAATMDVISGYKFEEPPANTYPIMWPADGQTTNVMSYDGTEWPDPLTSCPGFKFPSGPPIYLQIGSGDITPNVTATSFKKDGVNLIHCVFDETSYENPGTRNEEILGRSSLNIRDAIILIPKSPLSPGTIYQISITSNGFTHTWSFTALEKTP